MAFNYNDELESFIDYDSAFSDGAYFHDTCGEPLGQGGDSSDAVNTDGGNGCTSTLDNASSIIPASTPHRSIGDATWFSETYHAQEAWPYSVGSMASRSRYHPFLGLNLDKWDDGQVSPFGHMETELDERPQSISATTTSVSDLQSTALSEPMSSLEDWIAQPRVPLDRLVPASVPPGITPPFRTPLEVSTHLSGLSLDSQPSTRLAKIHDWSKITSSSGEFRCAVCSRAYNTRSELRHHERKHTSAEDRPHLCGLCNLRFLFPKDLARHHQSKHEARKSLHCHICSRAFNRRDNLTRHLRQIHGRDLEDFPSSVRSQRTDLEARPAHSIPRSQPDILVGDTVAPDKFSSRANEADANSQERSISKDLSFRHASRDASTSPSPRGKYAVLSGVFGMAVVAAGAAATCGNSHERTYGHDHSLDAELSSEASKSMEAVPRLELEHSHKGGNSPASDSASELDSLSEYSECQCRPEGCHTNACVPEELEEERIPDIRKLIAFAIRSAASQSSGGLTTSANGDNLDTARLERTARHFLSGMGNGGRHGDGDSDGNRGGKGEPGATGVTKTASTRGKKRYWCPFGAACDHIKFGIICDCCDWPASKGSLEICHLVQHIQCKHVDKTTGLFKHYEGHGYTPMYFSHLSDELKRLEVDRTSGHIKWRYIFRFIHSRRHHPDIPSPYVTTGATQQLFEAIMQLVNERDLVWDEEAIMKATAGPGYAQPLHSQTIARTPTGTILPPPNPVWNSSYSINPAVDAGPSRLGPAMQAGQHGNAQFTTRDFEASGFHTSQATSSFASSRSEGHRNSFLLYSSDDQTGPRPSLSDTSMSSIQHLNTIETLEMPHTATENASLLNVIGDHFHEGLGAASGDNTSQYARHLEVDAEPDQLVRARAGKRRRR